MVVSENRFSILKLSVPFFYQFFGLGRSVYGKVLKGGTWWWLVVPVSGGVGKELSR